MIRFGRWRRSNAAHARHVVRAALAKLPRHVQLEVAATLRAPVGPAPGLAVSETPPYVFVVRFGKTRTFNAIRQMAWARPDLLGVTFERRWMGERRRQQRSGQVEGRKSQRRSPDLDGDWVRRGFVLSTMVGMPVAGVLTPGDVGRTSEETRRSGSREDTVAASRSRVDHGGARSRPLRARRAIAVAIAALILLPAVWWLLEASWPSDRVVALLSDLRQRAAWEPVGSPPPEMSKAPTLAPHPDGLRPEGAQSANRSAAPQGPPRVASPAQPGSEASGALASPANVSRGISVVVSPPGVPKEQTGSSALEVPPPPPKPELPRRTASQDSSLAERRPAPVGASPGLASSVPTPSDVGGGVTVAAGTGPVPGGPEGRRPASAAPALVRILAATGQAGRQSPAPSGPPAAPRGLGFLVDGRGYVLTHIDVIRDGRGLEAALTDGRTFAVKQVWRDTVAGVAVLWIDGRDLPALPLGESTGLRVGDATALVAWPTASAPPSVGATIRAIGSLTGGNLAIDALIPPEDVGGPLINARGQVVGIASADARFMDGGSRGTVVPIDRAKSMLRQAQASAPAESPALPTGW
jgi:S1-C subfamily serine protease